MNLLYRVHCFQKDDPNAGPRGAHRASASSFHRFTHHVTLLSQLFPRLHTCNYTSIEMDWYSGQEKMIDKAARSPSPPLAAPLPLSDHQLPRLARFFHYPQALFVPPPPPLMPPPARILVNAWDRRDLASATIRTTPSSTLPRSYQEWINQARCRTIAYSTSFAVPAVRWVLVDHCVGDRVPDNFIQTGVEGSGEPLYSIRAWFNDGLHLGKGGAHIHCGPSRPSWYLGVLLTPHS